MTIDLNEMLINLKLKLKAKQKAERFLKELKVKLNSEKQKLKELFEIMQKEEQDVKKLKRLSLVSLYHDLIGNKQAKLNKEQVEFFAAKMKYDSCQNSIHSLKREVQGYQDQIADCDKYEAEYIDLVKNNSNQISNHDNEKFIEITDEIVRLKSNHIEVNEALEAGRLAKSALNKVIEKMQSASNWGLLDMFAGGLIVTAIKHSKINQSQQMLEQVNVNIEKFNRELSDIQNPINTDLKLKIGGFKKFADYFFDGIIFDWLVQSKIKKSIEVYTDTEAEISRIIKLLLKESSKSKEQVAEYNDAKLILFK